MMKVILFLTFLPTFLLSHSIGSYQLVFGPIIEQCNKTFIISKDLLYMEDVDKFMNLMKVDRNGKCFVHCFLQKLDLVDPKGNVRKQGLFDNIRTTVQKLPGDVKNFNLNSQQQRVTMGLIEKCENSDSVKLEADPCDKQFKFFTCFLKSIN